MRQTSGTIEEKILKPINGVAILILNIIVLIAFCLLFAFGIFQGVQGHDILAV